MPEREDATQFGRAHGVEMAADPKDVRAFLRRDRVIDDDAQRPANEPSLQAAEDIEPENVGAPRAAREEAMERLPMAARRNVRHDERLRHSARSVRQDPASQDDDEIRKARARHALAKAVFPKCAQADKSVVGHGLLD